MPNILFSAYSEVQELLMMLTLPSTKKLNSIHVDRRSLFPPLLPPSIHFSYLFLPSLRSSVPPFHPHTYMIFFPYLLSHSFLFSYLWICFLSYAFYLSFSNLGSSIPPLLSSFSYFHLTHKRYFLPIFLRFFSAFCHLARPCSLPSLPPLVSPHFFPVSLSHFTPPPSQTSNLPSNTSHSKKPSPSLHPGPPLFHPVTSGRTQHPRKRPPPPHILPAQRLPFRDAPCCFPPSYHL